MKRFRDYSAIRRLCKPFIDFKRLRAHRAYLLSPDSFYLRTLRGIHAGERCFVLGNGPSLCAKDLNRLVSEKTFAANRIYKIFDQTPWRPTYFTSVDREFLRGNYRDLPTQELGHLFIANYPEIHVEGALNHVTRIFNGEPVLNARFNLWNNGDSYICEDVYDHICDGQSVTFTNIQLAIYMGFKEIYLLGVDHNYQAARSATGEIKIDPSVRNYFDKPSYPVKNDFCRDSLDHSYRIAREYCDAHGITIRNATRGGKLEVFERVDFDKLFVGGGELWNEIRVLLYLSPRYTFAAYDACGMESEVA